MLILVRMILDGQIDLVILINKIMMASKDNINMLNQNDHKQDFFPLWCVEMIMIEVRRQTGVRFQNVMASSRFRRKSHCFTSRHPLILSGTWPFAHNNHLWPLFKMVCVRNRAAVHKKCMEAIYICSLGHMVCIPVCWGSIYAVENEMWMNE